MVLKLDARFNSAFVQTLVLGAIGFCCPGIFNALNGLGRGGGVTGLAAALANLCLCATFALCGFLGGAFFKLLGTRIMIGTGGIAFAVYISALFVAAKYPVVQWVAAPAGVALGVGAAWFWTAQGTMVLAYAVPEKKGEYISTFWVIFNLGAMVGGFLAFAMNFNRTEGSVSDETFLVFVSIAIAGSVGAFLFLVPASSVIREDGSSVVFDETPSSTTEDIVNTLSVASHKPMLLLLPCFIASNFFFPFLFHGYNAALFTIRSRGLNSAFYWASQMLGSWCMGKALDQQRFSMRRRGLLGVYCTAIIFSVAFVLIGAVRYLHPSKFGEVPGAERLDFSKFESFAFPFFVYLLFGIGDACYQTCAYWLVANVAHENATLCARYAGFFKASQNLANAVAWGLELGVSYEIQFWLAFAVVIASFPAMICTVLKCIHHGEQQQSPLPEADWAKDFVYSE